MFPEDRRLRRVGGGGEETPCHSSFRELLVAGWCPTAAAVRTWAGPRAFNCVKTSIPVSGSSWCQLIFCSENKQIDVEIAISQGEYLSF